MASGLRRMAHNSTAETFFNEDILVGQLQIAQATELVVLVVLMPVVFSLHHAQAHD
jgi:hypothetical protein